MSEAAPSRQFAIQKLYLKDASFESPGTPQTFGFKQWSPKIDLNIGNSQKAVDGALHEVVLSVTVTVSLEDKTVFLIEAQQAGLFLLDGFSDDEKKVLFATQCMTILFPYAREVISDLSVRGGFPPLVLSPVNFDALYQQQLQQRRETDGSETIQ